MAGLGRMVVRGLGAAMQGYGKTLTDQADEQQKRRELDGALMRAEALATFQHGQSIDTVNQTAAANVAEHAANAMTDTTQDAIRLGPKTDAQIKIEQAKIAAQTKAEYELLPAKTKASLTLEEFRANAAMARTQVEQTHADNRNTADNVAAGQRSDAERGGKTVATGIDPNGDVTVAQGSGRVIRYKGLKPTPQGGPNLLSLDPTPTPSSAPAQQASPAPDYSVYNGMKAEAAMHPAFAGMSAMERLKKVRELAQAQNIPIPPDESF